MFKKSSHKKLAHCALLLGIMSTFGFESFADNIPVPTGDQVKEGLIIPDWKNISGFEPYWVCDITGQVKMGDYLWQANVQLSSRSKEKPKEVSSNEIQVLDIRSVDQLTVSPHDRVPGPPHEKEIDKI